MTDASGAGPVLGHAKASRPMWKIKAIRFAVRGIALLCLFFGFTTLLIKDGQVFTHALLGIVCGIATVVCSLIPVQNNYANGKGRWWGLVTAGLGVMLVLSCAIALPWAYRFQTECNDLSKKCQERQQVEPMPNHPDTAAPR
jgi:TRAP-type uncharacterized transport system fused permease subunit